MTVKGEIASSASDKAGQATSDDDVLHFLRVGNECMRAENWSEAQTCFRRVVELRPRHPEAKSMLAMSLFRMGALTEAKRLYYQLIEQYPENSSLLANLVTILMRQGSLEEAEDILQSFLQISPKDSKIHHQLAAIYRHKGNLEQARAHYLLAGSNASAEDVLEKLQLRTEDPLSRRRELQEALSELVELSESDQLQFDRIDPINDEPAVRDLEHWESLSNAFRVEDSPAETLEERLERMDERLVTPIAEQPSEIRPTEENIVASPTVEIESMISEPNVVQTVDLEMLDPDESPEPIIPGPQIQRLSELGPLGFHSPDKAGPDAWLTLDGQAFVRSSILVAASGELDVGPADVPATTNHFLKIEGSGKCLLRVPNVAASVKDVRRIFVRASALAGFEGDLQWSRKVSVDIAVIELSGRGSVLLNTPQTAVLAKVEPSSPLHIRKDLFLAWSKDVQLQPSNITGVEGQHVTFAGSGMVILAGSKFS
ncbi:MAG: tetratricopeptide repeat protein [Myxococcota bacterium]|nr:tetratricopeptide repeat protein [Myxococcota bacterium]